ncbi:hypothetical protein [Hyphococcus sp.]|uniref:hypothetical protein n=1 Tax=Hyphococcus sp. TaxID=2038636 RepID=UPI0020891196|nr:MAG: hypothetical protein DHS20C04_09970 [Marinicaulis sp.]
MILRRVIAHFRKQEWTAIALDFVIVVVGVFVGIQVSNWNGARIDQQRAQNYLERIGADLDADIAMIDDRLKFWSQVADYGALGLDYAETRDAGEHTQWELLLAYFQASQVAELALTRTTYEELKSAGELGLIADPEFRNELSSYYIFTASASVTERPPYREHVRGVIPLSIQSYIWGNCYESNGADWQGMFPCASPIDEARAAGIVDAISKDAALMAELRYWMSSMHVSSLIGGGRLDRATAMRQSVNEQLAK